MSESTAVNRDAQIDRGSRERDMSPTNSLPADDEKLPESQKGATESPSKNATEEAAASVVEELLESLNEQRLSREVKLALRTGLRDVRAEFSFLRVRGLRCLLNFLRSVAESDATIRLFCHSQFIPELQVVPVLFQHSLKEPEEERVNSLDHIFTLEPMKLTSPSTDTEVALALRVLEGCCLIHRQSTILAHQNKAIPVLMNILLSRGLLEQGACLDALIAIMLDSTVNQMVLMNILLSRGVLEQGACLDALIAIMLDSTVNQMDFETCDGIEEVAAIIRDQQVDENLRFERIFQVHERLWKTLEKSFLH